MGENKIKCKLCKKEFDKVSKNGLCEACANKPPQKYYFDVKVECMVPATLIYRVYAENAEKASLMIKGIKPNSVLHRLEGRKELKLTVYDAGCSMIRYFRNIFGG